MTLNVEVIDSGAIDLLSGMERLNLIRLVPPSAKAAEQEKISGRFGGAVRLSDAGYEAFQDGVRKGRDEWDRDICWIPTQS